MKISFESSNVVLYGAPVDISTSFGRGTLRGPEAIRITSARQVETFLLDENLDFYERARIYDIGDLKLSQSIKYLKRSPNTVETILSLIGKKIHKITSIIQRAGKVPVLMGGEHTLSYYALKALSDKNPLVIHFDAHRDMKPEYEGMKMCHTTPFYHIINDGFIPGKNIIQIGIRQTDREENEPEEHLLDHDRCRQWSQCAHNVDCRDNQADDSSVRLKLLSRKKTMSCKAALGGTQMSTA